jgi:hypothetical protein
VPIERGSLIVKFQITVEENARWGPRQAVDLRKQGLKVLLRTLLRVNRNLYVRGGSMIIAPNN